MPIKRIVVDVLIPHEPDVLEFAEKIGDTEGVEGATVHVMEIDEQTKTVEVTIEGADLSYEAIRQTIEQLGASVHSIDMVSAGTRIVDSHATGHEQE